MKYSLSGLYNAYMAEILCCLSEETPRRVEQPSRPMRIEHQQPRLISPPIVEPQGEARGREWVDRTKSFASRASSRGSFSVRRTLNAYNGPRRPRISGPTEFRHVENVLPRRTERFRPLELSIYAPQNQLSPILTHFELNDDTTAASIHSRPDSFQIARKPVRSSSRTSGASEWTVHYKPRPESLNTEQLLAALESDLPKAPAPARLRSMTEPPAYQRVKSALHEKHELEQRLKDIEETIEERKSIYLSSRPTSRALSRRESIYSDNTEPMPAFDVRSFTPVLPVAPSFAARVVHSDRRPRTADSKPVHIPTRLKSFSEASATFSTPSPSSTSSRTPRTPSHPETSLSPPPPLPLVLQSHPPLRKKKSFSRVSTWLFPASSTEHARTGSLDSVTNTPKPLTSREGFYQCVDVSTPQRLSTSSASTISTMVSDLDEPALPNTWTPDSSPGMGQKRNVVIRQISMDSGESENSFEMTRGGTFGRKEVNGEQLCTWRMGMETIPGSTRNSVGIAF